MYSEVEIMLPAGEYVFRVASHWCSFDDKLGKGYMYNLSSGLSYQKTSTNVWAVTTGGFRGAGGTWTETKEIKLTVTADNPTAGEFIIMDIAPPYNITFEPGADINVWLPIAQYLYDSHGATDPNSSNFSGIPVELAIVDYDPANGFEGMCVTDNNGYYFGIKAFDATTMHTFAFQINNETIADTTVFWEGSLTDLFNKTLWQK